MGLGLGFIKVYNLFLQTTVLLLNARVVFIAF